MRTRLTAIVLAVSANANSFGLHGHKILVADTGDIWEVGRSIGAWNTPWTKGTTLTLRTEDGIRPVWANLSCEIPRIVATTHDPMAIIAATIGAPQ